MEKGKKESGAKFSTGIDLYDVVKTALTKYEGRDAKDMEKFRKEIQEKIGEPYSLNIIRIYLELAIKMGDRKVAEPKWENIFYDEFKNDPYWADYIPVISMKFARLEDVIQIDTVESKIKMGDKLFVSHLPLETAKEVWWQSQADSPLLIIGETGTSKQLFAEVIHKIGNRRKKPFMDVDCVAIPETLLESELFGYEKGAHSLAKEMKKGLFELANGGTIFLDEIGKMSPHLQAKLLKVIEQRKFMRLGGKKPIEVDVRFIAAAQPKNVHDEEILPDLKYRLGYPDYFVRPTLNEQLEKTRNVFPNPVLENSLRFALEKMNLDINSLKIDRTSYDILLNHNYLGNYRELENILKSAVRSARKDDRREIYPEDFNKIFDKIKKFSKPAEANKSEIYPENVGKTKLINIIDYSNSVRASIVETKLEEIIKSGEKIKTVLIREGLPAKKYQGFLKKLRLIRGKGIRDINKPTTK